MRFFLALGLLITLCASSGAATVHHSRHRVIVRSQPGLELRIASPPVDYGDVPAKRPLEVGGSMALPATT